MAILRPDIYKHNNPNLPIVLSEDVKGGALKTNNLTTLVSDFIGLEEKLEENVTVVFVVDTEEYYRLIDKNNVDLLTSWKKIINSEGTSEEVNWGDINGNIANQTDLQEALGNKEDKFNKNTAFNKNFGTGPETVAEGNHTHQLKTINGVSIQGTGDISTWKNKDITSPQAGRSTYLITDEDNKSYNKITTNISLFADTTDSSYTYLDDDFHAFFFNGGGLVSTIRRLYIKSGHNKNVFIDGQLIPNVVDLDYAINVGVTLFFYYVKGSNSFHINTTLSSEAVKYADSWKNDNWINESHPVVLLTDNEKFVAMNAGAKTSFFYDTIGSPGTTVDYKDNFHIYFFNSERFTGTKKDPVEIFFPVASTIGNKEILINGKRINENNTGKVELVEGEMLFVYLNTQQNIYYGRTFVNGIGKEKEVAYNNNLLKSNNSPTGKTTITLPIGYIVPGTIALYVDGQRQTWGNDYDFTEHTITVGSSTKVDGVVFNSPSVAGKILLMEYKPE